MQNVIRKGLSYHFNSSKTAINKNKEKSLVIVLMVTHNKQINVRHFFAVFIKKKKIKILFVRM
jgi:hypothetical protein